MIPAPAFDTEPADFVGFCVAYGDVCRGLASGVDLQRRQEVSFVIFVKITKHVLKRDVSRRCPSMRPVDVVNVEAGIGFVMSC